MDLFDELEKKLMLLYHFIFFWNGTGVSTLRGVTSAPLGDCLSWEYFYNVLIASLKIIKFLLWPKNMLHNILLYKYIFKESTQNMLCLHTIPNNKNIYNLSWMHLNILLPFNWFQFIPHVSIINWKYFHLNKLETCNIITNFDTENEKLSINYTTYGSW